MNIKNDLALDVILQEEDGYYYIFTTLKVIEHVTDGFRSCRICSMLKKQYTKCRIDPAFCNSLAFRNYVSYFASVSAAGKLSPPKTNALFRMQQMRLLLAGKNIPERIH